MSQTRRSDGKGGCEHGTARGSVEVVRFRDHRSRVEWKPVQAPRPMEAPSDEKPTTACAAQRRFSHAVEAREAATRLDPRSDDYVDERSGEFVTEESRQTAAREALTPEPPIMPHALEPFQAASPAAPPPPATSTDPGPTRPVVEPPLDPALVEKLRGVDELFARLKVSTHYALLGLGTNASAKEVRTAYFALAKRFHPDVFFRREVGGYLRKLEAVFDALTRAYETLRRPASRAEYDDSIGVLVHQRFVIPVRHSMPPMRVETENDRVEREVRRLSLVPPGPFGEPAPYVHVGKVAPSERDEKQQERHTPRPANQKAPADVARARASRPSPQPGETLPRPSAPQGESTSLGWIPTTQLRDLEELKQQRPLSIAPMSGVNRRPSAPTPEEPRRSSESLPSLVAIGLELHGGTGLENWVSLRLRDAHQEELAGHITDAANILRVVLGQHADARIAAHRDRLARVALQKNLPAHRSRARSFEGKGQWQDAADCWETITAALPDDGVAFFSLARSLLKAGNLKAAGRAAVRAAELNPAHIETRELLVEFFERMDMKLNARRERETLQKLLEARIAAGQGTPGSGR